VTVEGGKGKRKRTVECVICTYDHYTNQRPLLRGPKLSIAYCAASDDNGGFSIFKQQVSMTLSQQISLLPSPSSRWSLV
jgi:hypothetical protein